MTVLTSEMGRALGSVFGPDFMQADLSQKVVFGQLDPQLISDSFGWSDLNEILTRGSVEPAEFKLCRDGRSLPEHDYVTTTGDGHKVLDLPRIDDIIRSGASLVIDSLDRIHHRIREATDDVMRMVGELASCNMFVTFGNTQAFASHFDEVDTFIVQVLGTKSWTVHGASEPFPLPEYGDSDPSLCPDEIMFDKTLEPGDVIHVPRGWWHTVRGGGDVSLHLTFAFTRRTGFDWLRWLVTETLTSPDVRESLHRGGSSATKDAQAERIIRALLDTASNSSLEDFFTAERRHSGGRALASLPWDIRDERPPVQATVELTTVLPPMLETLNEEVVITANDQTFTVPRRYSRLCRTLIEARRLTIGELAIRADSSPAEAQALVSALLRTRLVAVS